MKVDVRTYNEGSRISTIHYREKLHKLQDGIKKFVTWAKNNK